MERRLAPGVRSAEALGLLLAFRDMVLDIKELIA